MTINTIEKQVVLVGALSDADAFPFYDTSTFQTRQVPMSVLRGYMQGAPAVAAGAALALTQAAHSGKTIALDTAAGSIVTLPPSTGGGAVYKFLVTVTATSNSHIIKVTAATDDEMRGFVVQDAGEATAPNIWWAVDDDDTITLNRTTSGLAAQGEYFEVVDAALNHYFVRGFSAASDTEETPFSATVA